MYQTRFVVSELAVDGDNVTVFVTPAPSEPKTLVRPRPWLQHLENALKVSSLKAIARARADGAVEYGMIPRVEVKFRLSETELEHVIDWLQRVFSAADASFEKAEQQRKHDEELKLAQEVRDKEMAEQLSERLRKMGYEIQKRTPLEMLADD